jgi:hypothetical protein
MAIEFEQQNTPAPKLSRVKNSTTIGWLMKKGIVANEKQAEYLILIFCLISFILMGYIYASSIFGFNVLWFLEKKQSYSPAVSRERIELLKEEAQKIHNQ